MALHATIRNRLTLPAVCAPMTMVSGPDLVAEACKAGIAAGLPYRNAGSLDEFEVWMASIYERLERHADEHPDAKIGPLAVNGIPPDDGDAKRLFAICKRHGVELIITAMGSPVEAVKRVHDFGALHYHDVTTVKHAEKAIRAGVDGLTCIGAGGGGHSGTVSHLALIPKVRSMFEGTIIMAGAVTTGVEIRAAQILGADLAYLGTRFIGTQESRAPQEYKDLLVSQGIPGLLYTSRITGVMCNWLTESLRMKGLDPDDLPMSKGHGTGYDHMPPQARPWQTIYSAGQGIELIDDIPRVAELVRTLRAEYVTACRVPDMADVAELNGG